MTNEEWKMTNDFPELTLFFNDNYYPTNAYLRCDRSFVE
jgi:hypothetical protein